MVRGICLVVFGVVLIRSSKVSARLEGFEAGDKGIRRSLRYCSMFHSSGLKVDWYRQVYVVEGGFADSECD